MYNIGIMSFKTQILEQLATLNTQFTTLQKQVADEVPKVQDAQMDFASNEVISKRNYLEALVKASNIFRGAAGNESIDNPIIDYSWNYKIYPNANVPLRYWWEINDFISQLIPTIPLTSDNDEQRVQINILLREALLFDDAYLYKDGEIWKACRVSKVEGKDNKYKVCPITYFNFSFTERNLNKNVSLDGQRKDINKKDLLNKEYTLGTDLIEVITFFDRIGIYVKAIPYLQTYLVFNMLKQRSTQYISLIPDTSTIGNQTIQFITHPEVKEIKNKALDNQDVNLNATMFEKVKWYQPEAQIDKVFGVLNLEIDKAYELLATKFGVPVKASDDKQTLSSESNLFASKSANMYKNLFMSLENIIKLTGGAIKFGLDKLSIQAEEEAFDDITANPNENTNASKENTQEEKTKKNKPEGVR